MAIELTIHGTGTGTCSLTGKEGEGMTVTFKDGTVKEAFLSQKAFMQFVRMKGGPETRLADRPKAPPAPAAGQG
jgi:hypothetical protein